MSTPDFTTAQIAAVIGAVIAVAVAFGVHITNDQRIALLALAAVIAPVIVWADVQIRKNRAQNLTAIQASQAAKAAAKPAAHKSPAKP